MSIKLILTLCFLYILFIIFYSLVINDKYYFKASKETLIYQNKVGESTKKIYNIKNKLLVTFFDVGQGDSIFIKTPNGKNVLIDGGVNNEIDYKLSKMFVYPFCNIEYIFMTHFHKDHYGGLTKITQRCKFNQFFSSFTFNDIECTKSDCKVFDSIIQKKFIKNRNNLTIFDVILYVVWPELKSNNVDYTNLNNLSLVILVDYGEFEMLLTGDAEIESLSKLDLSFLSSKIENGLDVYKASHHGAKNAHYLPLIKQLNPINCIISVGSNNTYGHPNSNVLADLTTYCKNLFRTDIDGDVTFIY